MPEPRQRLFDEAIAKDKTIKFYDGASCWEVMFHN